MIGIVGMGIIGSAQARMFGRVHDVVTYDPRDDAYYPFEKFSRCRFVVVCVGTPATETGAIDLSQVEAAAHDLPANADVLLRSSVIPGTTERLFENGTRKLCYAPEFMGEREGHPWPEATDVPYMLLGGELRHQDHFLITLRQVFPAADHIHRCSIREAELAKYVANLYWATRVTFVNEMGAIAREFGVDFERVREAWLKDPRMTPDYTALAGHPPGFGGRCWPKDLSALIDAAEEAGNAAQFLRAIREANDRFIA